MQPGTKFGHYTVLSAIGKGGMGEVYRARDTKLGREVALKTLPKEFARDADRLARQAAGDLRIDIKQVLNEPRARMPAARKVRLPWLIAAAVLVASAVVVPSFRYLREAPGSSTAEMRLQIVTPSTPAPLQFALSPDGRQLVFVASGDGPQRLWLRALNTTDARPMPGTEGAVYPFWSADSRSIGFFRTSKLYRLDVAGERPQEIASAPGGRGATWNADDTILFAPGISLPLMRVEASGSEPIAVTRLEARQSGHTFPQFLPDGRRFLFYASGPPESSGIYLASLDGGKTKRLASADTAGAYLEPDHVVFVQQGALVARRLDAGRGELIGDQVTLAEQVGTETYHGGFSVSSDGLVAYRAGRVAPRVRKAGG